MAHGATEVVVPIGTVDAIVFVEIHGVGDVGEIIIGTVELTASFHFGRPDLVPNSIFSGGGLVP